MNQFHSCNTYGLLFTLRVQIELLKMQMELEQKDFSKKNVLTRKFAQTGKLAGSSTSSGNLIE